MNGVRRHFFGAGYPPDRAQQQVLAPLVLDLPQNQYTASGDSFDHESNLIDKWFESTEEFSEIITGVSSATLDKFSVSIWMKPNVSMFNLSQMVGSGANDSSTGMAIEWRNDGVRFYINAWNTGGTFAQTGTITTNVWHHMVGTFDKDQVTDTDRISVYVDAVRGATDGTSADAVTSTDQPYYQGKGGDIIVSNRTADGIITEVTLWNDRLTPSEVTELYNSGTPLEPTAHSFGATLRAWYRTTNFSGVNLAEDIGNHTMTDSGTVPVTTVVDFPP